MVCSKQEPEYTIPFRNNGSSGDVTIRVGIQPVDSGKPNSMRVDFVRSEGLPQDLVPKIRQELTEIVNGIVPSKDLVGFCVGNYDNILAQRLGNYQIKI